MAWNAGTLGENVAGNAKATPNAPAVTTSVGQVLPLDELEKPAIRAALQQTGGNRTLAAAALGITARTLRNKLHEYREAGDSGWVWAESAEG